MVEYLHSAWGSLPSAAVNFNVAYAALDLLTYIQRMRKRRVFAMRSFPLVTSKCIAAIVCWRICGGKQKIGSVFWNT